MSQFIMMCEKITQILFAPDKVQPAPSQNVSKLKKQIHDAERQATLRNNKILEAQKSNRALQDTIAADAEWLGEHNLKLGELKREHDEALAAARLLPVPEPTDIDTYDPTDQQVSINTGSFHLWAPAAQSETFPASEHRLLNSRLTSTSWNAQSQTPCLPLPYYRLERR